MGDGGSGHGRQFGGKRGLAIRIEGGMVGSGIGFGMRRIGRYGAVMCAALIAVAIGPATAQAEPPTVTIATPSSGSFIDESPTISGTTTDTTDLVTLVVSREGSVVREESTLPESGVWTLHPTLPDGTYSAVARQTELATLEEGFSAETTFTLDTAAPNLTLKSVSSPTSDSTPSFGGNAGEGTGEASPDGPVRVEVLSGETAVVTEEVGVSSGTWALTVASALPDGPYTVKVTQQDQAGNKTERSASFVIDTTAPQVSLVALESVIGDATPSFHGGAGTATGDASTVKLTIFAGTAASGTVVQHLETSRSGASWSASASKSLADGTYTAIAEQADSVGNPGKSLASTFTIDTVKPGLSLNSVSSPTSDSTPSFGGNGGEGTGEASPDGLVRVEVLSGETPVAIEEVGVSSGAWSYTVPSALADGGYTVKVTQQDQAGNKTERSASFVIDTTAPQVSLVALPSVVGTTTPTFEGTSGTAPGDAGTVKLTIFAGTAAEGTVVGHFEPSGSSGSWSATAKALADGTYTAIVEQLDSAGNKDLSLPSTFTIKTKGPAVSLDPLAPYTNNPLPSFSGGLGTAQHDVSAVTVEIHNGTDTLGKAVETVQATPGATSWTAVATTPLADGQYTAIAKQRDEANNVGGSIARTFTVDTQAPQPTLSAPGESTGLETVSGSAGTATGDRRQVTAELFSGGSAEGAAIEMITVLDNADGTWSATFAGLAGGQYTVVARQSDEAGNTGSSAAQSFTVNAPQPPAGPSAPVASFTWVPQTPTVGQSVSLVSKSTDASSAITGYGWDVTGSGPFAPGGPLATVTFSTPGAHTVRLQVIDANGLSSTVAETIQVVPQALILMQPFPIVRIAGAETSGGARIKLLTVQAPTGAKVAVSCKGRGCKTKSETRLATASSKSKGKSRAGAITLAFPRFQRTLGAGAVLQIRVTKSGQIGKFTSFKIRRRKLPVRVDACLRPPSTAPSTCPSQ